MHMLRKYHNTTMKKLTHPNTLTILNIITGTFLFISWVYYFYKTRTFDMSLLWIILGAMYLVMGSYAHDYKQSNRVIIFVWTGVLLSIVLAAYYFLTL